MQDARSNIKKFWDQNPLLSGEIESEPGTPDFFLEFDQIRTKDVFAGQLEDWVSPQMKDKQILDVGCGPGYWSRRINEVGGCYTGIDLSETAVALARKSMEQSGHSGTVFVADAEALPFADETFDFTICEGVIHHTPDIAQCLSEIYRTLRPGGQAVVSVYYRNIILRSALLFRLTRFLMRVFNIGLRGRGREKMPQARTSEEFVRMYDGADNPLGKCYTIQEMSALVHQFEIKKVKIYYLPLRALRFKVPEFFRALLMPLAGTMILFSLRKPRRP